jgi:hypothetical protein
VRACVRARVRACVRADGDFPRKAGRVARPCDAVPRPNPCDKEGPKLPNTLGKGSSGYIW